MATTPSSLLVSQAASSRHLLIAASFCTPLVAMIGWIAGNGLIVAPLISLAFLAIGWGAAQATPVTTRLAVAVAVVGQPIALTAAFSGHAWQVDSHMAFFAAMATLVLLVDTRAILLGAAVIVLHHLSLSVVFPGLIYPSSDLVGNIGRTLMHGAIVAVETAALIVAVRIRLRLTDEAEQRESALAAAEAAIRTALSHAEEARTAAELQSQKGDAARRAAEEAQARILIETRNADELARAARARQEQDDRVREAAAADQRRVVAALRDGLGRLSNGDLSARLEVAFSPEYEDLRHDFNAAIHNLAEAIGGVAETSHRIRGEADALNAAAGKLATRTERQAATLEQTSATMTEFTTGVKTSALMAADAETSTTQARAAVVNSTMVVQKAIVSMQRLADSSQKIARINAVIDEIAFQTNLLALNAGVEAARAGEAGRGFAVVASEVRALAQRCSDAAKEITVVIQESGAQVEEGVTLVGQAGTALTHITESVSAAAEQVATIARTASDQAQSLTEMNAAIADLDHATQQNAAMFNDTTTACQTLTTATDGMIRLMSRFAVAEAAPVAFQRRRQA